MSNSGRITTDLSDTRDVYSGYWRFYLLETNRDAGQELNFANHTVSARFNSHGDPDPFNGGQIYFFIGEWLDSSHYSFYRYNTSFVFNVDEGGRTNATTIYISGSESEWTLFAGQNAVSVTNLFDNPQQYGFVILGQSGQPTNRISMDDFAAVIPEPATISLLGVAVGLGLLSRGRHRSA